MSNFESILGKYRSDFYQIYASPSAVDGMGDMAAASKFMDRYGIDGATYLEKWQPIAERIFLPLGQTLPAPIFREEFKLSVQVGGCLLTEEEFARLQQFMIAVGDREFVVIQNEIEGFENDLYFKLKFPVGVTWDDLKSGSYVSTVLIEMPHFEYYIFGDSGTWGVYVASDYIHPIDIIGFSPEMMPQFIASGIFPLPAAHQLEDLPEYYQRFLLRD
jgi:hypothetical protein